MVIETASIDDCEVLSGIAWRGKAYWGYASAQLASWREDLTITQDYVMQNDVCKLVDKGAVIGFFSLEVLDQETVKIGFLFLEPKFIGQEHGKMLMRKITDVCVHASVKRIMVDADPNAKGFYEHFGFVQYAQMASLIPNRFLP